MNVDALSFEDDTNAKVRKELTEVVESSSNLDDIIDRWLLEGKGTLYLSRSITNEGALSPDEVSIGFNSVDQEPYGDLTIKIDEITAPYKGVVSFDTFIKGWSKMPIGGGGKGIYELELDSDKLEAWTEKLGFEPSYVLYASMGPRRAAVMLILAFAISTGGFVDVRSISEDDVPVEDFEDEIEEEGIVIGDYFRLIPGYCKDLTDMGASQMMFDFFHCKKN